MPKPSKTKTAPPPEDRAHAKLGPSSLKSRELCPSYRSTPGDSKASLMGTKLHSLMERFGIDVAAQREFTDLDSDEQHAALEAIATYIEPFERAATKIHRELQLDLTSWQIPDCDFGTADLVLEAAHGAVHLMDYKFGRVSVEDPETNIQMWVYALGIFANFPKCSEVHAHVLQPLRDEIGHHVFNRADIEKLHLRASTIAHRVKSQAGQVFNVVPSNCRWCSNKAHCAALHDLALHVKKHARLSLPDESIPLSRETLLDAELVLGHGALIHDVADLVGQWAESMRRHIANLAYEGYEIQGKRLVVNTGKSNIANATLVAETLAAERGCSEVEVFREIAQIPIGAVDRMVAERAPKGAKDAEKKRVRELLRSKGALTVGAPSHYLVDAK